MQQNLKESEQITFNNMDIFHCKPFHHVTVFFFEKVAKVKILMTQTNWNYINEKGAD
jgi:hypothetical protein